MSRSNTPKQRTTRSNSTSNNEISRLVDATKELKDMILGLRQDMTELRASVNHLNTRMSSIESAMTSISQTQAVQQSEIKALQKSLHDISDAKMDVIQEVENRELRRLNLVVSGVVEKSDGSIDERKAGDRFSG